MERKFVSMFVLMLAVLFAHNAMAQSSNVIFEEKFASDFGKFKVEGYNGQFDDIWTVDNECVRADAYRKIDDSEQLVNYLVSPQIQLGDQDYQVRFEHCCDFFKDMENEVGFVVREVNGQWIDIKITKFWQGMFTIADKMAVPSELKGKCVEFGFKYTAPGGFNAGIWKIKNFSLEVVTEKPTEKADPMISYGVTDVTYDLGNPDPFKSPELFNIFMVPVTYTSENEAVATVNEMGVVTVLAKGNTKITATTVETDDFKVGTASYNLTVTDVNKDDPNLKDPEISFDVTEVEYEMMSGEAFVAPVLNNPHKVNVKYYSDNSDVASIDEQTGEITIKSTGVTVIKALSAKDGVYHASFAKYTLKVLDSTILYVGKDFADNNLNGFTEEGEGAGKYIWMPTVYGGWIQASGYAKVDKETVSYMVSPEIKLDLNGNNLSFIHTGYNYPTIEMMKEYDTVWIREVGGEWQQLEITYPSKDFENVLVDRLPIPEEFNGKTIQVGFKYVCDGTGETSGTWAVKDIFVRRNNIKAAANISFSVETVDFIMSDGASFAAPELSNPEGLEVTYISTDENVAMADVLTGEITINGAGTTVIRATAQENEKYAQTTVYYVLNVTESTGIDSIINNADGSEKMFDIQGRRVNKAENGIYIVNGNKIIVN